MFKIRIKNPDSDIRFLVKLTKFNFVIVFQFFKGNIREKTYKIIIRSLKLLNLMV